MDTEQLLLQLKNEIVELNRKVDEIHKFIFPKRRKGEDLLADRYTPEEEKERLEKYIIQHKETLSELEKKFQRGKLTEDEFREKSAEENDWIKEMKKDYKNKTGSFSPSKKMEMEKLKFHILTKMSRRRRK